MSCATSHNPAPIGGHGEPAVCAHCYSRALASVENLRRVVGSHSEKMMEYGDRLKRRVAALEEENKRLRSEVRALRARREARP